MEEFLECGDAKKQIVCLGAGFDTTYYRLKVGYCVVVLLCCFLGIDCKDVDMVMMQSAGKAPLHHFEVDFPFTVQRKSRMIRHSPVLCKLLGLGR
jgi:O-methyltransferase involved in polyketide biosynthesis